LPLVAERGCELVLMHMRGSPADMQRDPRYRDPLAEIADFLRERVAACLQAGIELSKIVLDPGIGFGKRLEDNLDLLRRLGELRSLGRPLCLGVSRKSFIARAADGLRPGGEPDSDRSGGTAAAIALGLAGGAELLRVHDVARAVEAAAVALAVLRRPPLPPTDAAERNAFEAAGAADRLQGCSTNKS
jgi:dihydropteroate synthase